MSKPATKNYGQKWVLPQTIVSVTHVDFQNEKDPSVATIPDISSGRMRCCLASPTACDPQLDRRTGLSSFPRACSSGFESTVMGNLLIVPPTAIGLLPPPFFLRPHSLALYSIGTANCGTSPLSMTLTRSVKADRRHDPASAEPWATNERRWPGWRPSGPPEASAWKDKIPFRTSSSKNPSGGSGRL